MDIKTLRHYTYDNDRYPYGFAYNGPTSLKDWLDNEIARWCFNNFGGEENDRWECSTGAGGHGYSFRNKEDAVAFKLRWI